MISLTAAARRRALTVLVTFHIAVIAASNYLVQLPFQVLGLFTTWGTLSFPLVYLATDLTVRIFGAGSARKIVFAAMFPALAVSYLVSVLFFEGRFQGATELLVLNGFVLRIAVASFLAYVVGQLADVAVFARLRRHPRWWVAPASSSVVGNLLDTVVFYGVAFQASSDPFMALHWPEIAAVDYGFKVIVSIALFLPAYGLLLTLLTDLVIGPDRRRPAGNRR